ncbi:hypothetical protein [Nonomuraea rosea]|uniref:hypothetical protein n=1 Tax=Nonomuraea rosea TaxID=638574 RepID=UPI0031ED77B2
MAPAVSVVVRSLSGGRGLHVAGGGARHRRCGCRQAEHAARLAETARAYPRRTRRRRTG